LDAGLLSPWHIAILAVVLMFVFGPKKLPELGRSLGRGIREFKDGITHHHEQLDQLPPAQAPKALEPLRDRDSI
jgi:sec-independent protein translocase protein TatA